MTIDSSDFDKKMDQILADVNGQKMMRMISLDAELSIDENFTQEGRYQNSYEAIGGNKEWKKRKRIGNGHPVLSDKLKMRNSVKAEVSDGILVLSAKALSKKGFDYAPVHQLGSRKKNIPARPFMCIAPKDLDKMIEKMEWMIEETFNK
jgi:phage gpG-like protein